MFYPDGTSTFPWMSYNFTTEEYVCKKCTKRLHAPVNGRNRTLEFESDHQDCSDKKVFDITKPLPWFAEGSR